MTRGGRRKQRADGPERRCIVTGETRPVQEMIRFVVAPDGALAPDLAGKLPGRGIWVSAVREALDRAVARNLFARAARQKVAVPEGLTDLIEAQLAARVVNLISLTRKGGLAVAGYEKVKDSLARGESGEICAFIQACDGSARGKSKLSTPQGARWIGWLTAAELGRAFGRQTVIHAALRDGGLPRRVVEEAARLKGLRPCHGGGTAGKESKSE